MYCFLDDNSVNAKMCASLFVSWHFEACMDAMPVFFTFYVSYIQIFIPWTLVLHKNIQEL
jgi:hypothetical protein